MGDARPKTQVHWPRGTGAPSITLRKTPVAILKANLAAGQRRQGKAKMFSDFYFCRHEKMSVRKGKKKGVSFNHRKLGFRYRVHSTQLAQMINLVINTGKRASRPTDGLSDFNKAEEPFQQHCPKWKRKAKAHLKGVWKEYLEKREQLTDDYTCPSLRMRGITGMVWGTNVMTHIHVNTSLLVEEVKTQCARDV